MAAKPNPVLQFDALCKAEAPIYFKNTMQNAAKAKGVMGDIYIGVKDPDMSKEQTLFIPKNSVVCANEQTTHAALKANPDIRRYLREGYLTLLTEDEYSALDQAFIDKSNRELTRVTFQASGEQVPEDPQTEETKTGGTEHGVRPVVASLVTKAIFGSEPDETIVMDLKSVMELTSVERAHLQNSITQFGDNYPKLKQYVQSL